MVHIRRSIWNGFKAGYHSVVLPKLNVVSVDKPLCLFDRLAIIQ